MNESQSKMHILPMLLRRVHIIAISFMLLTILSFGLSAWSYHELQQWGGREITFSSPKEVILRRKTPLTQFSKELESAGLTTNHLLFEWWVRLFSTYQTYQAGRYRFVHAASPMKIDTQIRNGDTYEPIILALSIPEGFTTTQIFKRAVAKGIGSISAFEKISSDTSLQSVFPKLPPVSPRLNHLEGYLFPATYRFTSIPTPQAFVHLLIRTFFERLPTDYEQNLKQHNLTLSQAVTLASLIERETQVPAERSIISEVIHSRLAKGIPLAIDASTIYGIPDFDGNIRRKHLRDKSNPFNTRLFTGLPPGPISSPGEESLQAVVTPTHYGYWYYVVDAENFSQHRFAKTLKEHNKNVAAYWKARKKESRK